jgi:hypothetical protein
MSRPERIELERAGKWNVRFNDESCITQAEFGEGEQKIGLQLIFFGLGSDFELRVFGEEFRSRMPQGRITSDFGPIEDPVATMATFGSVGGWPMAIIRHRRLDDFQPTEESTMGRPPITPDQERAITWLDVRVRGGKTWRLKTGPMDKIMQLIRTCQVEMSRSWGYEPDKLAAMSRKATPLDDRAGWLRPSDYPLGMASRGANGLVHFRLDVSETGAVTGCHLQEPMNPPSLNELTCRLLKERARFAPALDQDGKPARSIFVSQVRWIIGG